MRGSVAPSLLFALSCMPLAACSSSAAAPPPDAPAIPDCGAGQRPTADNACAAVGPDAIPDGFAPDSSGWGFRPTLPPAPCTGATIARIGSTACEPIDDAAAEFPPKAATIAVSDHATSFPGRPNLTVYKTLADALGHASAGATIAIDEGTYETAPIAMAVHIVGRGAAKTSLHGADFGFTVKRVSIDFTSLAFTGAPKAVILADDYAVVRLNRVYFHGDNVAINAGNMASIIADRTVFEGPASSSRPFATNALMLLYQGVATLRDVEMRGYQTSLFAQSIGTAVNATRTVIHEERTLSADPAELAQIGAFLGAKVTLDASYVESSAGRIAAVGAARYDGQPDPTSPGNPPASLQVTHSALVHAVVPREAGSAIDAYDGATVSLDEVTLAHECYVGLGLASGASLDMKRSVILGGDSATNARAGVMVDGGDAKLDTAAIIGSTQFGVVVTKGSASLESSLVYGNREIGRADPSVFMGAAQAVTAGPGGRLALHASALVANEGTALSLTSASADVQGSLFASTRATKLSGITCAVLGVDAALSIDQSAIAGNHVALALRGGRVLVRESTVADHREAFRIEDTTLVVTDDTTREASPSQVVASATRFDRDDVISSAKPLTDE